MSNLTSVMIARQQLNDPITMKVLRHYGKGLRVMVDSGAYIDFSHGREPWTVQKFIDWIREIEPVIKSITGAYAGYMTLDVIGDPVTTRSNYETLLDAGLSPIPIITRGTGGEDIRRYQETSDYVGFGGIARSSNNTNVVRWLMNQLQGDNRAHWLGFANHNFVNYYRPQSVDTSAWVRAARFGEVDIYMGNGGFSRIHKGKRRINTEQRRALRRMGFAPSRLEGASRQTITGNKRHNSIGYCVAFRSYVEYAREIERNARTHYYFVYSGRQDINVQLLQLAANRQCVGLLNDGGSTVVRRPGRIERDTALRASSTGVD